MQILVHTKDLRKENSDYLRIQTVIFAACFGFQLNFRHRSDPHHKVCMLQSHRQVRKTHTVTAVAECTIDQFPARISKKSFCGTN